MKRVDAVRTPPSDGFPAFPENGHSLLKKHLTRDVWMQLNGRTTRAGVTLLDCIRSGIVNTDSEVGLYAGDAESYVVFAPLFAPVIADCHPGFRAGDLIRPVHAATDFQPVNPDPEGKYIVSTRLRLARNFEGHGLRPGAVGGEDCDVEHKAKRAFARFSGDLAGSYRALGGLPEHSHAFKRGDRFQDAAGLNRNWPEGRGVFANASQTFFCWVNEEDHLRVIAIQRNADIVLALAQLRAGMDVIAGDLTFQYSDTYGYISSCPTNLGTGLRISFRVKLPLSGKSPAFEAICARHHLAVRGISGEHEAIRGYVYEISNKRRLGLSEAACLQECLEGTSQLIDLEKSLEAVGSESGHEYF